MKSHYFINHLSTLINLLNTKCSFIQHYLFKQSKVNYSQFPVSSIIFPQFLVCHCLHGKLPKGPNMSPSFLQPNSQHGDQSYNSHFSPIQVVDH